MCTHGGEPPAHTSQPLLWALSYISSSPAVNLLPEDSISGVQLCPQVHGVKKVQSNYSTSGGMLKKASLLYTGTQKHTPEKASKTMAKCVKNILTL